MQSSGYNIYGRGTETPYIVSNKSYSDKFVKTEHIQIKDKGLLYLELCAVSLFTLHDYNYNF